MEIDLGVKPSVKVKLGTDCFDMSVPSVKNSMEFSKLVESCSDDFSRTELFVDFMSKLGLPKEVIEELSLQQLTMLSEGLMGSPGKK